mgnify:CR=1 FL=1
MGRGWRPVAQANAWHRPHDRAPHPRFPTPRLLPSPPACPSSFPAPFSHLTAPLNLSLSAPHNHRRRRPQIEERTASDQPCLHLASFYLYTKSKERARGLVERVLRNQPDMVPAQVRPQAGGGEIGGR